MDGWLDGDADGYRYNRQTDAPPRLASPPPLDSVSLASPVDVWTSCSCYVCKSTVCRLQAIGVGGRWGYEDKVSSQRRLNKACRNCLTGLISLSAPHQGLGGDQGPGRAEKRAKSIPGSGCSLRLARHARQIISRRQRTRARRLCDPFSSLLPPLLATVCTRLPTTIPLTSQ